MSQEDETVPHETVPHETDDVPTINPHCMFHVESISFGFSLHSKRTFNNPPVYVSEYISAILTQFAKRTHIHHV